MPKSGTHFHFKQFSIRHDRSTMKVGTDGVLLGAWVDPADASRILDIGTGSGVIALMLAQRTSAQVAIHGVEIEPQDADQAVQNVAHSPWPHKVEIFTTSIQEYNPEERYDLIVSNPPYFNNSQEPPDKRRVQTRHTILLTYQELLQSVVRLLTPAGKFSVILPYTEGIDFIRLAAAVNLHCIRQWSFRTRREKPVERWLLTFSAAPQPIDKGEILLYEEGDQWSVNYTNLTREFYLKL
jgi:tRNA1Val (adenine37-N6)-methyltransferase